MLSGLGTTPSMPCCSRPLRAQCRHVQIANHADAAIKSTQPIGKSHRTAAAKAVIGRSCREFRDVYDRVAGLSRRSLQTLCAWKRSTNSYGSDDGNEPNPDPLQIRCARSQKILRCRTMRSALRCSEISGRSAKPRRDCNQQRPGRGRRGRWRMQIE